jgi:hypothetical protein
MAHVYTISDGTTTFSLVATNCAVVAPGYTPSAGDGKSPTVTESIPLMLYAATASAMQTAIGTLERLLDDVRRRAQRHTGPKVYLTVQLDSDAAAWRTELVDARLELKENSLQVWAQAKMDATLYIERLPYFEGASVQIPLTNANGTNDTTGLTIYNHNDGGTGHDHYAAIVGTDITGNLPAPIKFELTNTTGSSQTYYQLFVSNNVFNDPGSFASSGILEAETVIVSGYGTEGSNADSSNGKYITHTGTGDWNMLFEVAQGVVADCAGYPFHILVRFRTPPSGYCSASLITATGSAVLDRGDEINVGALYQDLADFGALYIPPGGYSTAWAAHRLKLAFRTDGEATAEVDFIALFPAYSFREIKTHAISIANGDTIVDDGPEGRAYMSVGGYEQPWLLALGSPVYVWPGRTQRLYFLWSLADHTAPVAQTFTVKAWYRPRRSTV